MGMGSVGIHIAFSFLPYPTMQSQPLLSLFSIYFTFKEHVRQLSPPIAAIRAFFHTHLPVCVHICVVAGWAELNHFLSHTQVCHIDKVEALQRTNAKDIVRVNFHGQCEYAVALYGNHAEPKHVIYNGGKPAVDVKVKRGSGYQLRTDEATSRWEERRLHVVHHIGELDGF